MQKKYLLSIFMGLLIFSLTGCNNSTTSETISESVSLSTEDTLTTETEEIENNTIEFIAVVNSIDEKGITVYPFEDTCELWEEDDLFYIKRDDISVIKNGRSSIYDITYFYDAFIVKFEGTLEKKSSYSIITPSENTKITLDLVDDYKEIMSDDNTKKDETPIEIVDNDKLKADIEINTTFCKFKIPGKYEGLYSYDMNTNSLESNVNFYYLYKEDGREKSTTIFTINKVKKGSDYKNNLSSEVNYLEGYVLTENDNYIYYITYNRRLTEDVYQMKVDIIDSLNNTITIIE